MFMQPGWDVSYGVNKEISEAAFRMKKTVRFIDMNYNFKGGSPETYPLPKG